MMTMLKARLTQEITRTVIWGQVLVPVAQTGRLLRGGSERVALKMEKVVESMDRTMREQEKLTPRRTILARRTRVLIFWSVISQWFSGRCLEAAYQIFRLLDLRLLLLLLQKLLFSKCWAQRVQQPSSRTGSFQRRLQWGIIRRPKRCMLFDGVVVRDIAKSYV